MPFDLQNITTLGELTLYLENRFHEMAEEGFGKFYHPLYGKATKVARTMRSHTDFDYKPQEPNVIGADEKEKYEAFAESWLYRYRPNEPDKIRRYRVAIWEPITASLMAKPLTFLSRLFNAKLSGVDYPSIFPEKTKGRTIQDYLEDNLGVFKSLKNWLKERLVKFSIIDPNGFIAVRPKIPDWELSVNELPEPLPFCIPSENVLNFSDDFLISWSTDKSEVIIGKKSPIDGEEQFETEFSGDIFFVYMPDVTFRMIQYGDKEKKLFRAEVWSFHALGYVPAWQAGGDLSVFAQDVETSYERPCYQSFFAAMVPHLNEYAAMHNDQQAAFILRIFLEKYQKAVKCRRCDGTGEVAVVGIPRHNGKTIYDTCPTCKGLQFVPGSSVFDTWSVKGGVGANDPLQPPAGYVDIPTDIVKLVEEKLKQKRKIALSSIYMETLEGENTRSATGVGLDREREGLFTLLENISQNTFSRVGQGIADAINGIRYGFLLNDEEVKANRPFVRGPLNFNIRGLGDVLNEFKELSGLSVPKSMRLGLQLKIARQSHGPTSFEAKFIEAELRLDPLAGMTEDEILTAESLKVGPEKIDLFKHVYSIQIIHECLIERPDFLDLEAEEQKAIFNNKAEKMFEEIEQQAEDNFATPPPPNQQIPGSTEDVGNPDNQGQAQGNTPPTGENFNDQD